MISPELNMSGYRDEDPAYRLERMGLPLPLINEALIEARGAVLEHTSLDAPSAPGTAAYSRVGRCFGEFFCSQKHPAYNRVVDHNQIVFVSNRSDDEQFIFFRGNSSTGDMSSMPSSACSKGSMTRRLIDTNRKMLGASTYSLLPETLDDEIFPCGPVTRVLLYAIRQDKSIRAELSIPVDYEYQGNKILITDWRDRIIIPEIGPEGEVSQQNPPDPDQFDFSVQRKA